MLLIPYAGWPPIVIGSAIAFAPMSDPLGPGPFQKPPEEIGRSLWLGLWS